MANTSRHEQGQASLQPKKSVWPPPRPLGHRALPNRQQSSDQVRSPLSGAKKTTPQHLTTGSWHFSAISILIAGYLKTYLTRYQHVRGRHPRSSARKRRTRKIFVPSPRGPWCRGRLECPTRLLFIGLTRCCY